MDDDPHPAGSTQVSTHVVLLRAINLGARNRVPMAFLRDLLGDLGARDVVTLVASGQAVVDLEVDPQGDAHGRQAAELAARVHDGIAEALGLDIDVLVRSGRQLLATIDANPFPHLASEPKRLHVAFLDAAPDPARIEGLATRWGPDELAVGDGVVYLAYATTSHDSPLNRALTRIGGVQTVRNWNTVRKLGDLVRGRLGGP